ncbi:3-oxoacyl-ACP reductase [Candidatus Pantoea edessiphila]|uniref:3-oxoacyl-[acyl-carrier-protein] reductase n=1 Tax=Candidatus Pantoea edessiphila TaxID=2044610 RepID=A0A2P5SYV3_9GAMM|nr:3-oxoacyl-ACP reductase FabG [Candidatus Pantoea edessiphila]MBK4775351.1 3-oxoacyl-ACP reductase FabG [Pantoea sp. Edef]PPI87516.1 3-oxoacyl-ACP reductase [Candidatus Pantoea edessiphila]
MDLKNKVALVTGASRGIGLAIAEKLLFSGAIVIGTSTNQSGVSIIDYHLRNKGKGIILNVNDSKCVSSVVKEIKSEFGYIDILINNAGIIRDNLLIRMSENDWEEVIDTNLTSVFKISKAFLPFMIKRRKGRIITISSIVGICGNIGQTNYSSSKAGLIGFSKSLALEIASRGITVNVVSPGFIETDMTRALHQDQKASIIAKVPMKRLGKAQEVANVVAFLASEEASYITGEIINVNGGMYMI